MWANKMGIQHVVMVPEKGNDNIEFFSGWLEQMFGQIEGSNNVLGPHPLLLSKSLSKERKELNAQPVPSKKNYKRYLLYVCSTCLFKFCSIIVYFYYCS